MFPQIENANDVLIMPLERFRKEQISAAKVSEPDCTGTELATEMTVHTCARCTDIDTCVLGVEHESLSNKNPFSTSAAVGGGLADTAQHLKHTDDINKQHFF